MLTHEISILFPAQYVLTGKFEAPSEQWRHASRQLEDWELIVMLEGTLHLSLGERKYTVSKNEYLLCPPYVPQVGHKTGFCSFYWLHFTIPPLNNERVEYGQVQGKTLSIGEHGALESPNRLIVMMKQLQDSICSYNDPIYNDYLSTAVLLELSNEILFIDTGAKEQSGQQQLYNDILDYVKWNIDTNIKVKDVAAYFGYNPKYLSHTFNKVFGRSLKQYIINEKMEKAKFVLTDTNESVTRISQQLGFPDSQSFMKLFKKHVGMTPSEYRNTHNKRMLFYL